MALESVVQLTTFGPLAVGDALGATTVTALALHPMALHVSVRTPAGHAVDVAVGDPAHPMPPGPFDLPATAIWHLATEAPFGEFEGAIRALQTRFTAALGDDDATASWRRFARNATPLADETAATATIATSEEAPAPTTGDWRSALRRALIDRPQHALRLDAVMPAEDVPPWPCVLPWVRLEVSPSAMFAPCCVDYPAAHHRIDAAAMTVPAIWNGEAMRAFRRAMLHGGHPETCRETCVTLRSGAEVPDHLTVCGGPAAFVESQIRRVEDLLAGREEARTGPLELIFSPTTYCNYDCLMCDYGETGSLQDELGRPFYDALEPLLSDLRLLAASGGEPLASREFQAFLARLDAARFPQLRVALTTNLSYLTPAALARLAHVPWGGLTVSLNAATAATYARVNRGLAYERIRQNLDALYDRRARGLFTGQVTYNFVVLRANVDEIDAIADLSFADGAEVSYLLPHYNRNDESIFVHEAEMRRAADALARVGARERERGREGISREALARAEVLRERIERGLFEPIPSARHPTSDAPVVTLKNLLLRAPKR